MVVINSLDMASNLIEAIILSPAVHQHLSVDSCPKTFVVCSDEVNSADFAFFQRFVSENDIVV
jgi:hypothetical protein